jgi:ABC-2 type transport system ATP-binding protein
VTAALFVEDLSKIFPGSKRGEEIRALQGLSFAVPRGRIFGLLGPNGAGKTTTLKILTTRLRPSGGRATVCGYDVARQPLEVRRRISSVLQETAVELFLSVWDNLLTFGRFHGLEGAEARRRAGRVLESFQLASERDRKAQDLSGGYRRRVQVAKAFMVDTPVLFLDEFSTGMDPILKRSVMALLREEAAKGRTIVLTTQVLAEAEELCDDILILNKGRQVARGDVHSLKLLSHNVYEVVMMFERLPERMEEAIARLAPLRYRISGHTVELALKAAEAQVLGAVSELASRGRLLRIEVSGASLEDVFIELTREVPQPRADSRHEA